MNTLNRAITARFFKIPHGYSLLQRLWSYMVNSAYKHELTAAHHVLYLTLMGKDWRKAFTPITNKRKLANGAFYNWGLFHALRSLHAQGQEQFLLAPFADFVSDDALHLVRSLVTLPNPYRLGVELSSGQAFSFDAYDVPDTLSSLSQVDGGESA